MYIDRQYFTCFIQNMYAYLSFDLKNMPLSLLMFDIGCLKISSPLPGIMTQGMTAQGHHALVMERKARCIYLYNIGYAKNNM